MAVTDRVAPASPPVAPRRPGSGQSWLRGLLLRLHFYAGFFVGPFLLVAAVSGGLYALSPQLEEVVHRRQLAVEPVGDPVPLATQVAAALETRPADALVAVRPAPEPGATTRVLFTDPSLPEGERVAVFVDPGTGEVIDELVAYGSSGALPLRTWISNLHRNLHLGEVGRLYSELAASWLGIVSLAGAWLWWDRGRRRRASGRPGSLLRVDRTATGRARTLSRHSVVGAWALVGLLFLSATGLTWSAYAGANVADLRATAGWETPTVDTALGDAGEGLPEADSVVDHSDHAGGVAGGGDWRDIDAVAAAVDARGFDGHREIVLPVGDGEAWKVSEVDRRWPTQADVAAVAVGPGTAEVVDEVRFDEFPLAAKLTSWGVAAHMGLLFGLPNALVLAALAVTLVCVVVWGYRMWWVRRPTTGTAWPEAPVGRGAIRRASPLGVVVVVVLGAALAWALPVLGVSLLGFLLVDTVVGLVRRGGLPAST